MKLRSQVIAAAAAATLLLVLPVQAQDGGSKVSFDGIGFVFERSLGRSVNIAQVRAKAGDEFQPGDPAHISFTMYGARSEGQRSPVIGWRPASAREVRVYQVADLADDQDARAQLGALQRLLAERPDPAALSTSSGPITDGLPWVPPITEAARIAQARVQYVDTPEVSGISSVASFAQDLIPPTSDGLLWSFQGLSADGASYVSIIWTLRTDILPRELPEDLFEDIDAEWPRILVEATTTIEGAAPDAFTPDLDMLDSLVQTLTLPGGPASQVPGASPDS